VLIKKEISGMQKAKARLTNNIHHSGCGLSSSIRVVCSAVVDTGIFATDSWNNESVSIIIGLRGKRGTVFS